MRARTGWPILLATLVTLFLSLQTIEGSGGSEPSTYEIQAHPKATSPHHSATPKHLSSKSTSHLTSNTPSTSNSKSPSPLTSKPSSHLTSKRPSKPLTTRSAEPAPGSPSQPKEVVRHLDNVTDDVDSDDEHAEFSAETFFTIVITLAIVLSNCAILLVLAWTDAFSNFNKTFVYSLTFADLFIGLFITPYSIFLSVYKRWVFLSDLFCSVSAYTFITFLAAKLYAMTWLSVDHYVAVRKPERYGVMMSPTRSFCWICFSWAVAVSFCCPPLFSFTSAFFSDSTFMCLVDPKEQIAYLLTAGVLVSMPPIVAIGITNCYLFTNSFKKRISFYEKVFVELSARPRNYHITCVLCTFFIVLWIPFLIVSVVKLIHIHMDKRFEFYTCWLGLCAGFTHFIVMWIMSPPFRDALKELCDPPNWVRRFLCCCCFPVQPRQRDVNIITLPRKR